MALSNVYLAKHTGKQIDEAIDKIPVLENDVNTLKGEGAGSVKKALADAKAYTDKALEGAELTDTTYAFDSGADTEEGKGSFTVTPEGGAAQKIKIGGLKSAAYTESTAYDKAGAANTVKTELLGNANDSKDKDTIKGAKVYAKDYADGLNTSMGTRMSAAEGKLTTLTGADTVEGSVAKALKDANQYTDNAKSALIGANDDEAADDTIKGAKAYAKDYADGLNTAMGTRMSAAEGKLNTLTGTGAGSVNKAVSDAKSDLIGTASDPVDSDTIKGVRNLANSKIASVDKKDDSIAVDKTDSKNPKISVKLDSDDGNAIKLVSGKGLRVDIPAADTYTITKESSSNYAAVYHLQKNGINVGETINIPKDLVVESGEVVTYTKENKPAEVAEAGTYIKLSLQNQATPLYINVGDLIEYVTSGSKEGDMVFVTVGSTTHEVTATITDGTINKEKLTQGVQTSLGKADTALQPGDAPGYGDILTKTSAAQTYVAKEEGKRLMTNAEGTKLAGIAEGANKTVVDTTLSDTSLNPVQNKVIKTALDGKVNTETGKGLSSNDYTTAEKTKLGNIAANAQVNVIEKVKVNGVALTPDSQKAVNVLVPTGALASKDKVAAEDLTEALLKRITDLETQVGNLVTLLTQDDYDVMFIKKETQPVT